MHNSSVIIFLAVLFIAFRRDGHRDGGLESLLPLAMLGKQNYGAACNEDYKITELMRDQLKDTGKIIHDVDVQNCKTREMLGDVMGNQNRLALDAERLYNQRYIDEMRERNAELRLRLSESHADKLHQETINAIGRSRCEVDGRLCRIEDNMMRRPPFIPFGGTPAVQHCVPGYAPACG